MHIQIFCCAISTKWTDTGATIAVFAIWWSGKQKKKSVVSFFEVNKIKLKMKSQNLRTEYKYMYMYDLYKWEHSKHNKLCNFPCVTKFRFVYN